MWTNITTTATFLLLLLVDTARAVTLLTFDVDGTLIHGTGPAMAEGAHAQAFQHALTTVLGSNNSDGADTTSRIIIPVADALPRQLYQGSTDGLILLRYARAVLGVEPSQSAPELDRMMQVMYDFIMERDNEQVAAYLSPLPGVLDNLQRLATLHKDQVKCGLVTGNVEGIARRKMHAVGIFETGALHPACPTQKQWQGTQHLAFLGGFGSDYCSGDIDDIDRNHLDRSEQIAICARRCQNLLDGDKKVLKRVVHIGDAPADVLAAKAFSESPDKDPNLVVGMVAVATGSYSVEELKELAGDAIPGKWEPVVLERGMADPAFLAACGVE
jgi:phosphoglycolate phosphatase-like HAD superfamily hydrolase